MRFYDRRRRPPPAIIVVALIDILIVLLIFVMTTTTLQRQSVLRLALPESSQAKKTGAQEMPPLVVTIDAAGNLRLGPEAKPLTVDRLRQELAAATRADPDLKLAINADKSSPFGQVIKVMDAAKESKIRVVNAFAREASAP